MGKEETKVEAEEGIAQVITPLLRLTLLGCGQRHRQAAFHQAQLLQLAQMERETR
jgi:hypothetical protein